MVNTMGGKHFRVPKRPNKGRKYNDNTLKNRNNRTKRLAVGIVTCSTRPRQAKQSEVKGP